MNKRFRLQEIRKVFGEIRFGILLNLKVCQIDGLNVNEIAESFCSNHSVNLQVCNLQVCNLQSTICKSVICKSISKSHILKKHEKFFLFSNRQRNDLFVFEHDPIAAFSLYVMVEICHVYQM